MQQQNYKYRAPKNEYFTKAKINPGSLIGSSALTVLNLRKIPWHISQELMHEKSQPLKMNLSVCKPALALSQSLPFSVSLAQRYVRPQFLPFSGSLCQRPSAMSGPSLYRSPGLCVSSPALCAEVDMLCWIHPEAGTKLKPSGVEPGTMTLINLKSKGTK